MAAAEELDMGVLMAGEGDDMASAPIDSDSEPEEELTDEERMYAEDLGFDEGKALALKGFIKSCTEGGYL